MPSCRCTSSCGTSKYPALSLPHVTRMFLDVAATNDARLEMSFPSCANVLGGGGSQYLKERDLVPTHANEIVCSVLNHGLVVVPLSSSALFTEKPFAPSENSIASAKLAVQVSCYPVAWS